MSEAVAAGRVCLVTGASSGIGRAFAQRLHSLGYRVCLLGRRREKLQEVAASLGESGDTLVLDCDVACHESCKNAIDTAVAHFGKVDILVNCAGCMYFTLMKSQKHEDWHSMINTNCTGVVNMCGLVIPHFLADEGAEKHIINISSDAGRQVFPCLAVYNASKSFVQIFSKSLRCELLNSNIRVTDLQPGDVRTNLVMQNSDTEALEKVGVAGGELVGGTNCDLSGSDRNSVLDPEDVVDAGIYALHSKSHIGVHEIVIEPRNQMFGDPTNV